MFASVISKSRSLGGNGWQGTKWGDIVVDRALEVYWPKDKCFYEGVITKFDVATGKHQVRCICWRCMSTCSPA